MQGHAVSNTIPVVAANRVGDEEGQVFYGTSFIADQTGEIVIDFGRTEQGVLVAEFDLDEIDRERAAWGFFRDRRTDLYDILT
jgi:N-carbamoylputrescine amidase